MKQNRVMAVLLGLAVLAGLFVSANAIARVMQFSRNALDGTSTIDIEIHDATTGAFVDSDFNFIALDQS